MREWIIHLSVKLSVVTYLTDIVERALFIAVVFIDFFFFFQAEDGIRDLTVTGVQTCALPICDGRRDAERFGVAEVGVDRRDDDAGFDGDEVDADERYADPGVDDDALVEDPIEDIDEAAASGCAFDWHVLLLLLDGFFWRRRPE